MALSALDDKSKVPAARSLKAVLGRAGANWESLMAHLAAEYKPLAEKRGVRIEVKNRKTCEIVKKLAAIKMAN